MGACHPCNRTARSCSFVQAKRTYGVSMNSQNRRSTTDYPQKTGTCMLGTEFWYESVAELHAALRQSSFMRIQWIPTRRRILAAPLEPLNLWHFITHRRRRLMEPSAVPGIYRQLERLCRPITERLLAVFYLNERVASVELVEILHNLGVSCDVSQLITAGIVRPIDDGNIECRLRFVPYRDLLLVTDPDDRAIPDFSYIGRDSLYFADLLLKQLGTRMLDRGLDIGCGSGVQALALAQFTRRIEGTDINPRSVAYANLRASNKMVYANE
jgi:hypothetical protein